MDEASRRPFADGSVSLGIYVHDAEPSAAIDTLIEQAVDADLSGFEGVTISEHHAGYPGYIPSPVLATSWLLEAMPSAWSGPFPLLLPLRAPGLVVEELAWLHARHPGRVTAGFGSGYVEKDFAACRVDFDGRNARFRESLGVVAHELSTPSDLFAGDPVVATAAGAIPLVAAAKGPLAVELTARHKLGISAPLHDPRSVAAVHDAYLQAGGTGPRIRMRWVWLGTLPDGIEIQRGPSGMPLQLAIDTDPSALAAQLSDDMQASNSTCLSLRIHWPGIGAAAVSEQIRLIGTEVVPRLRATLRGSGSVPVGGSPEPSPPAH